MPFLVRNEKSFNNVMTCGIIYFDAMPCDGMCFDVMTCDFFVKPYFVMSCEVLLCNVF